MSYLLLASSSRASDRSSSPTLIAKELAPRPLKERDGAATGKGRVAVEEFAHGAYAVLLELFLHADERVLDEGDSTAPVELDAGLEVGTEEPRPYGAVVVGLLPLPL